MLSIKHKMTIHVVATILILAISFMVATGIQFKKTAVLAAVTKAESDIAMGLALLDAKYPGSWHVENDFLYKGQVRMNNNNEIVDFISSLTGDTCTIFMANTRVATTIMKETGERAIGTHSSDMVAKKVLSEGAEYRGEAEVVGEKYQTAYNPLYDEKGNIVGMFYVGISKKFFDKMFYDSLLSLLIVGVVLTALVFLGTLYFSQRVIIGPLKILTAETQKFAKGDFCSLSMPVEKESKNEIVELAKSINQMGEWVQALSHQINLATGKTSKDFGVEAGQKTEIIPEQENLLKKSVAVLKGSWDEQLPKGLNEVTLQQILTYLMNNDGSLSVSEIAEEIKLTKVTVRRYLDYLEKCGMVKVDMQYGPVGRPLKLYTLVRSDPI
ncbi:cache domain-containing protein [Desulforamulus ruminis]|uniref:Histidine kinase HAMP region domain protein n=2 Tax=Desulforamulus ruminis TaxID=1564 RepID=F6DLJ5_DESRL|nr:cache domain-containing protein [Desulforamulus ruminis]AEG61637.1 histidine kinase HAMP region domain protein [Desulforamulus ruminis DSM 2154]